MKTYIYILYFITLYFDEFPSVLLIENKTIITKPDLTVFCLTINIKKFKLLSIQ